MADLAGTALDIRDGQDDLVSVLVPAYNAERTIAETLGSVLGQTHRNIEIIVVDDGSTDATASIVRHMAEQDVRLRLLSQANAGVAAARNAALADARGAFVAPLDADDLWHPEKLERQLRRFAEVPERTGVVWCWSVDIDEASQIIERRLDLDFFEGDVYAALVLTNFLGNASVPLVRRPVMEAAGGWDASFRARQAQGCEDWANYLRLAELCDFALEPAFLVGYRQSPGAMSRQSDQMQRSYRIVLATARARHPELPAKLFRWSGANYDRYVFSQLSRPEKIRGLHRLLGTIIRDPIWLFSGTFRRMVRGVLRRTAGRTPPVPPAPIGGPFRDAAIHPERLQPESSFMQRRRAYLSAIRARS